MQYSEISWGYLCLGISNHNLFVTTTKMKKIVFWPFFLLLKNSRSGFALHLALLAKRAAQLEFLCSSLRWVFTQPQLQGSVRWMWRSCTAFLAMLPLWSTWYEGDSHTCSKFDASRICQVYSTCHYTAHVCISVQNIPGRSVPAPD